MFPSFFLSSWKPVWAKTNVMGLYGRFHNFPICYSIFFLLFSSIRCHTENTGWCGATDPSLLYKFLTTNNRFYSSVLQFLPSCPTVPWRTCKSPYAFQKATDTISPHTDNEPLRPLSQICNWTVCVCVCVMLAQFTEMIVILLNNCRDLLLGPAIVNMSALLHL